MKLSAAIYGAGGHARVIASILRAGKTKILGFFDDSYTGTETIQGAPVLGRFQEILNHRGHISKVYIAIGDNQKRDTALAFLQKNGFHLPSLIHPNTVIESNAVINDAAVICIGAIIAAEASIGTGAIINTGCSVDHETRIGNFVHLAPKVVIAGRTTVGDHTFIGMNTCVADQLRVGNNVVIGAGSVILKDVPDNARIMGVYH